jgi:hypothetical protein
MQGKPVQDIATVERVVDADENGRILSSVSVGGLLLRVDDPNQAGAGVEIVCQLADQFCSGVSPPGDFDGQIWRESWNLDSRDFSAGKSIPGNEGAGGHPHKTRAQAKPFLAAQDDAAFAGVGPFDETASHLRRYARLVKTWRFLDQSAVHEFAEAIQFVAGVNHVLGRRRSGKWVEPDPRRRYAAEAFQQVGHRSWDRFTGFHGLPPSYRPTAVISQRHLRGRSRPRTEPGF